jgi:hypothetical protein
MSNRTDRSDGRDGVDRESTTGMPRWMKVAGIVTIVVLALLAILLFSGLLGEHGPARHQPADQPGVSGPATPGHVMPSGGHG